MGGGERGGEVGGGGAGRGGEGFICVTCCPVLPDYLFLFLFFDTCLGVFQDADVVLFTYFSLSFACQGLTVGTRWT